MNGSLLPGIFAITLMGGLVFADENKERSAIYPFDVKTGDETAALEGSVQTAIFARLKNPVAKNAAFALGIKDPTMIIVNVFKSNHKGEITQRDQATAKVIMVQNGTSFSLDKAMDGKVLEPGSYAMNIVVREMGTSRVLFTVAGENTPGGATTLQLPEAVSSGPVSVLEAVFEAARTGDFSKLRTFESSDPDGDVKMITRIAKAGEKEKAEFVAYFEKGKTVGTPRIEGNLAQVDFLFGPTGKKTETMNFVQENGKWLLSSF